MNKDLMIDHINVMVRNLADYCNRGIEWLSDSTRETSMERLPHISTSAHYQLAKRNLLKTR